MPHKFVDQKPKNTRFAVKSFIKSLGKFRFTIVLSLTFALIANILNLFSPKIIGNMTNSAVESVSTTGTLDFAPIKQSLIFLIVIIAVVAILSYFESFLLARTTAHYTRSLRSQIIQKIARLPISYFDKHQFGDTLSILSNDVDALWNALTEGLTQIITSLTTIIGCLVMMIIISPLLALVAVVVVPLAIFTLSKIIKRAQSHFVSQRKVLGQLNARIEEDYSGQLIIKSNSHESASFAEFQLANQKLYEDSWKAQFLGSLAFPFVHFFTNLGYVAVCVLGGQMVLNGTLLIGGVQAFIQYLSRFNHPLSTLSEIVATIEQTLAAAEREESPDPEPSRKVKKVQGAVEFHDVSFSYDKKRPVINHFSVKVNPGEQVAIVGPTGAGKTTIINLLMRFYDPDSGYITIDGVPTREMKRSDVRALFGMVLQDTWLFSGSIKDNLKYGNSSATLKELKKATSAANIDHLIESMKGGYNAEINEDSDNISAGEKQLLTIARAMVENPPMMILDEATSNVDTRAEALIQEAFNKLTHGRIAHRLSTIRNANLILVMKDGAIVEQGTHAELLKQNGFYAELYNSQFAPKNNA